MGFRLSELTVKGVEKKHQQSTNKILLSPIRWALWNVCTEGVEDSTVEEASLRSLLWKPQLGPEAALTGKTQCGWSRMRQEEGEREELCFADSLLLQVGGFLVPEIGRSLSGLRAWVQYERSCLGQLFMSK